MEARDEVQIGDWVTCCFKGYWQIIDIKQGYEKGKPSTIVAIVKKGFTTSMKYQQSMDWCDIRWCKKVNDTIYAEILDFFDKNPDKKLSFEQYTKTMYGITDGWLLDLKDEEVAQYNKQLKELQKYFSKRQFNKFVEEIGLRDHMYKSSSRAKYMMTIVTYPWLVDEKNNNSSLYFIDKGIYLIPGKKGQ